MTASKRAFERAMRLAVVSGLRATYGVALVQAAHDRPNKKSWALAAMGEALVDKIPFAPSRGSLLLMLPLRVSEAELPVDAMRPSAPRPSALNDCFGELTQLPLLALSGASSCPAMQIKHKQ